LKLAKVAALMIDMCLVADISHKDLHAFWCILSLSVTFTVDECEFDTQFIGDGSRPGISVSLSCVFTSRHKDAPLSASGIRADNNPIPPCIYMILDVGNHQRLRPQVIHRYIKEALDLTGVQVHSYNMVASSHDNHIRNQLGRDWSTRFILFVHPGIRKTRDDGGDSASRGSFTCRDQNKELHEIVIHIAAS
jgi:hypothetical protein